MRVKRAVDIQIELVGAVRDLYSMARTFKLTSAEINERYAKLIARYPKLPRHVENYVRGYRDCLSDSLYHHDLFHAYEWQGKLYEKWDSMPEELKEHIKQTPTDSLVHGHYWKGTSRPYFLGA